MPEVTKEYLLRDGQDELARRLRAEKEVKRLRELLREARQFMGTIDYVTREFDATLARVDAALAETE